MYNILLFFSTTVEPLYNYSGHPWGTTLCMVVIQGCVALQGLATMEVYVASSIWTRAFGRHNSIIADGCCSGMAVKRGSIVNLF